MHKLTWQIIVTVIICSLLLSCISTPALPNNKRLLTWAQVIDPVTNLYQVDQRLYRSQQPKPSDISSLQRLHIGTIINLRPHQTDQDLSALAPLRLIHVPMRTWAISNAEIAEALIQINHHSQDGGVLVHCQQGADRTGLVIAMYRIIYQQWSIKAAQNEMKHGGFGFHPIWINIDQFFNSQHIEAIKNEIQRQQALSQISRKASEHKLPAQSKAARLQAAG